MTLYDPTNRPILGSSARPVLTIVLEGRTLNFGANTEEIKKLPRDTKIKAAEILIKLLFPEIAHVDPRWLPR